MPPKLARARRLTRVVGVSELYRRGHDSYGEEEQQGWSQSDVASERYDQEEDDDGWVESESAYSQEEEEGRYGQQSQQRQHSQRQHPEADWEEEEEEPVSEQGESSSVYDGSDAMAEQALPPSHYVAESTDLEEGDEQTQACKLHDHSRALWTLWFQRLTES